VDSSLKEELLDQFAQHFNFVSFERSKKVGMDLGLTI